jgi:hypothetical protein
MESTPDDLLKQGDVLLKSGDYASAVQRWRDAADAGLEPAAAARMKALIRGHSRAGAVDRSVPRQALVPLKVMAVTAVFGSLCFFASNHGPDESDVLLVWLGWILYGIAFASALAFASQSGRLDGRTGVMRAIESMSFGDLADHAASLAMQLDARRNPTTSAEAPQHG